jgi:hypothetical protein
LLVIEQLAQDLSSSPPFRVIAPIAVEPMLGQPIAAIMQASPALVSQDPRPYIRPSTILGSKGSIVIPETETVSM